MFLWVFNIFSPVSSGTAFWYNASMKKAAQQKEDFYGPHDHQGHCPAGRGLRHHRFPGAEQCAGDQLPDPGARAPGVPGTGLPLQPAGSEPSLQPDPCAGRHSAGALRPFSRLHRAAPGALRPGTGLPDHVVLRPGRGQRNRRPVRLSGKSPGGRHSAGQCQQRRARSAAAPRTGDALRAAGGCVPDRYAPADQRCQHRQLCRRRHGGRIPLPAGAPAGAVSGPPAGQRHPCAPAPGLSHHRQGAGHGGGDRLQPRRRLLRPQRLPAGQAGVRPPLPADGGLRSLRRHGPGCPPGGRRAGTGHSRPDPPAGL